MEGRVNLSECSRAGGADADGAPIPHLLESLWNYWLILKEFAGAGEIRWSTKCNRDVIAL